MIILLVRISSLIIDEFLQDILFCLLYVPMFIHTKYFRPSVEICVWVCKRKSGRKVSRVLTKFSAGFPFVKPILWNRQSKTTIKY